jgi:hypothetical protein
MANKNSLLKQLTSVLLARDITAGGGNTTLNGAVAKGATVITLTSATNFAVGDTVRIGNGSQTELAVLTAGQTSPAFNVAEPLARDHATGEAVVEQLAYDLGDVTESGVDETVSRSTTDVNTAIRRLPYTILYGYGDLEAGFTLPSLTLENIAIALGIPLANVQGTGANSTNPKFLVTDTTEIDTEQNASLIATGVTMDGTPVRVELWGISPDYSGFSVNLRRGALAGVPARFIATAGGRASNNASAYVANTTIRGSKSKVFDSLTEVGFFVNGATQGGTPGTSTIATSAALKGQKVVNVASGTNYVAGDWVKIGAAELVEFHRIASVAVNALTLATNLLRDHQIGETVTEQTLTPFANIGPDGVTLAIGGTIDRLREATRVLPIGARPVGARISASFPILDYIVSAIARAVGKDPATIVSSTFAIDDTLGTNITDGVYVRGLLQDGTTAWLVLWGCAQDIARAALSLVSTGQPTVPTAWVPSSGILLMQHT